jgi:hypothetical protein
MYSENWVVRKILILDLITGMYQQVGYTRDIHNFYAHHCHEIRPRDVFLRHHVITQRNYNTKCWTSRFTVGPFVLTTLTRMSKTKSKSKSKSHCDWRSVSQSVSIGIEHPPGAHDQIFIAPRLLRSCFCWAPSLTRGRVCLLYMLLALASAVFLGS